MKFGAVEYLVRGTDETATFRQAARLGFSGIEAQISREDLLDPEQGRLSRLIAARDATGVAVPSFMMSGHNQGGIANSDESVASAAAEDIRIAIGWAEKLGSGVILVPFFFKGDFDGEDDFQRAAAAFRELCPLAREKGISLTYEGTLPAAEIRRLAEAIGPDGEGAFGCYFDLANVVWRGMDTATEIRELGALLTRVHMKESYVGPGDRRPGLGRVNYAESAAALKEIAYDDWLVFETPGGPAPLIRRDIAFARRWFTDENAPREPRIGTFSGPFKSGQLDELIEAYQANGLRAVQIGPGLLDDALAGDAEKIAAALGEADIEISGIAGYRNLVVPDESKRRANIDHVKRCLEVAPRLGAAAVATETGTCHPDSDWTATPENWGDEAWGLLHAALDELLPVAESNGSILALEGYVNNVLQHVGQVIGLLEKYPTPHLQLVLDPYNYISAHLLPEQERIARDFLERFEDRFVIAHLKDVCADGAEVDTPEFGTGVFPQKLYLEFLRDRRSDLALILEHLPFDHIPAAMVRIRDILG